MKGSLWIAGGLIALGAPGPGRARPQEPPPRPPRPPVVALSTDLERLQREAREMAREALRSIDRDSLRWELERMRDELRWQLPDFAFDYDFDYAFDYDFDYDFDYNFQFDLPDFDFQFPELPELPDIPDFPEFPPFPELPELTGLDVERGLREAERALRDVEFRFDRGTRIGSADRLMLLDMTVERQGDPGLALFNEAKALLFDRRYEEARAKFQELVQKFAASAYRIDAEFWSAYALEQIRGQTEAAFKAYQAFLQAHPQGPFSEHAQASMVQLAGRLYRQGMAEYKQYVESAREAPEEDVRLYALQALSRMEDVDLVPGLEKILADPSASTRLKREALDLLRRSTEEHAVAVQEGAAREHADPEVRAYAIASLGSRRDRVGLTALQRIYQGERSRYARRFIVEAATAYRNTEQAADAAAFLARIAESDADQDVRQRAVESLSSFKSEAAIPHIQRLMEQLKGRPEAAATRRQLLRAWARSDDPRRIEVLREAALTESDEANQRAAVSYLGGIEGPEALDALIAIAQGSGPEAVRVTAVDEIGDLEGSRATEVLVAIARSNAPVKVRQEAMDELGNRQVPEAFDALSAIATGQGDRALRESALSELRAWGAASVPVLERVATGDPEMNLRESAVSGLGRLEEGAGWEALARIFNSDADSRLRRRALDYLWRISEERSMSTVIGAAKSDRDSEIRRQAVRLLGSSESAAAKRALQDLLNIPPSGGR
jgi:HEAT repeat protein